MDLEQLRAVLRQTELAIEQSKSEANVVGRNLLELRNISSRLVRGYGVLEDACRQTERRSDKALETLVDIEGRLGPLEIVRDLTNETDDRLAVLRRIGDEVMQRSAVFQVQQESVDLALARIAQANARLATLDERVTTLTASDKLQQAEATVEHLARRAAEITGSLEQRAVETAVSLEQRAAKAITSLEQHAAETTSDLERRIGDFEAHEHRIGHALAEAARSADLVAHLEAHLATLTGPDQALTQAGTTVEHLQQRALEAIATLEQRAVDATASLERRAADTTTALERRLDTFDVQKQAIAHALGEATRVTDLVASLEARLVSVTGSDQALDRAEARVGLLQAHAGDAAAAFERRAAETIADLERRIEGFDAQQQAIAQALAEAARVTDLVAAMDVHVATLTGPDRDLAHAQAAVDDLERRAAAAATRLQLLARTNDDLELAITTTEQHLSTVRVAARGVVIRTATPFWPFVGGYAALVASAVVAVFVLRNPGPPVGTLNDAWLTPRESAVAETSRPPATTVLASPLPPPTLPVEPVGAAPPASTHSASAAARSGIPSASAEARAPAASSSPSPAQPAAVRQAAAPLPNATLGKRSASTTERRGGPAARPGRAIEATEKPGSPAASPQAVAATKDAKQFVGVLAVESVPAGAAVFLNQQSVGQTPLNLPDVRAGTHAIRVEHDGYARWTATVLVFAGKQTRITSLLQPIGPGPGANSDR
jgi:hypothetical protein